MTLARRFKNLILDQDGGMTVFMIFWMIIFFIFGGLAVDSSNAWRMRAELQATADATAHAAIFDVENQAIALATANEYAEANMPGAMHGDVLVDADVVFGKWDGGGFTPEGSGGTPVNAVQVTTYRASNNANGLPAYFLRLAGMQSWDVSAQAIAARFTEGTCLTYDNVIMAEGQIFLNPLGRYEGELCMHSNDHIRAQPQVAFGNGAMASMPDEGYANIYEAFNDHNPQVTAHYDEETGEYGMNEGLGEALEGNNEVELLTGELNDMSADVYNGGSEYLPDNTEILYTESYVVGEDDLPETLAANTFYSFDCGNLESSFTSLSASLDDGGAYDFASVGEGVSGFLKGVLTDLFAAHAVQAEVDEDTGANTLSFDEGSTSVVVVTDCPLKFNGGAYVDSAFVTTAEGQAVQTVQGGNNPTQIGADDACAEGGETHMFAPNGDFHSSAKSKYYDAHFVGGGDFHLAAQGGGKGGGPATESDNSGEAVGINVQVAGSAHITALAGFNGCPGDANTVAGDWGYRLVQ